MAGIIDGPVVIAFLESYGIAVPQGCTKVGHVDQVYDVFPALKPLYFDFETNFDCTCLPELYHMYWPHIPLAICAVYIVGVFGYEALTKSLGMKPFDLKWPLAAWNLFLSVFSLMGMSRMVPHVIIRLSQHGYYDSVCMDAMQSYGNNASGLWIFLFIFSKIPELVDTIFIVLRQKPLILLHWYHHVSVLCYCWHAYGTMAANGAYFAAMNYTVHGVMYGYYFLMAVNMKPKALRPEYITIMQLVQMMGGIAVVLSSAYYKTSGASCSVQDSNLIAAGLMYASYFLLFFLFALNRYGGAAVTVLAIPMTVGVIAHLALNVLSPVTGCLLLGAPACFTTLFALRWWEVKHLAGPAALPLVGTPFNTASQLNDVSYLETMEATYGDVFVYWSGASPTVVVLNAKCQQDILADGKTFKEQSGATATMGTMAREVAKATILDLGKTTKWGKKLTVQLPVAARVVIPSCYITRSRDEKKTQ
jgi:elongation of very long chain fatty acids protein 6